MNLTKNQIRMKQAVETASFSKCCSRKVGAIIVVNDRIVGEGYNGTPKGYVNCDKHFNNEYTKEHHDWSLHHEIHAEMNAILWAARKGTPIEGGIMYSTTKPCKDCTKHIIASGIVGIHYLYKYPYNDDSIIDSFLEENGVYCVQEFLDNVPIDVCGATIVDKL